MDAMLAPVFLRDLYETANTALPEYRRQIQDDIGALEKWAGVKNGVWSKEQVDRFTRQFDAYVSEWMPGLARKFPQGEPLDPVVRGVLDRMFGRE